MGQYYYVVNITKKEYLHPHAFGDGLKLREFAASGYGTMLGLALLLADGNGQAGGDIYDSDMSGRWAGDKIVIAGDYADNGRFCGPKGGHSKISFNLQSLARDEFKDISIEVIEDLAGSDYHILDMLKKRGCIDELGKWKKVW